MKSNRFRVLWPGLMVILAWAAVWPSVRADDVFGDQVGDNYNYYVNNRKPWHEQSTKLPAFPRNADLVPVAGPGDATLKLFVDKRSISLGKDRVVRLTYVLESPSGAHNVYYEGFRCSPARYKTYAFGTDKGVFQKMPGATWEPIPITETNNFRRLLYHDYLCTGFGVARSPKQILDEISSGNE